MAKDEQQKLAIPIETNPFYKHYKYDLDELVPEHPIKWTKINKQKLRTKVLLRKASIPYFTPKSMSRANEWLTGNLDATNVSGNWTMNLPKTKLTTNPYIYDDLTKLCNNMDGHSQVGETEYKLEGGETNRSDESVNVNELASYMENTHLPKPMGPMAEMMYS